MQCMCGAEIQKRSKSAHQRTARHAAALLERAVSVYLERQDRVSHPDGSFERDRRFFPSDAEWQPCCNSVSAPTKGFPFSLMVHCRSVGHVAALFGVDASAIRKAARAARPATRLEAGDGWFKAVALVDGRMLSVFDGKTEYRLGEEMRQAVRTEHGGGFYAYPTLEAARRASVPSGSALIDAPRVVLRVRVDGAYSQYGNGKVSWSRLTPLEVVEHLQSKEAELAAAA